MQAKTRQQWTHRHQKIFLSKTQVIHLSIVLLRLSLGLVCMQVGGELIISGWVCSLELFCLFRQKSLPGQSSSIRRLMSIYQNRLVSKVCRISPLCFLHLH